MVIAEYRGDKQIGGAKMRGTCRVSPEISKNVNKIFHALPKVEGTRMGKSYPSLDVTNECYGTIDIDDLPVQIVLKKNV